MSKSESECAVPGNLKETSISNIGWPNQSDCRRRRFDVLHGIYMDGLDKLLKDPIYDEYRALGKSEIQAAVFNGKPLAEGDHLVTCNVKQRVSLANEHIANVLGPALDKFIQLVGDVDAALLEAHRKRPREFTEPLDRLVSIIKQRRTLENEMHDLMQRPRLYDNDDQHIQERIERCSD